MLKSARLRPVVLVATLLGALALVTSACSASNSGNNAASSPKPTVTVTKGSPSTSASPTKKTPPKHVKKVHISLLNADGSTFGVGMPEIAYFNRVVKNGVALQKATTVTVNGKPAKGAWYFEQSAVKGFPVEAHYRLQHFWPANSKIFINIPAKGLSAGGNLVYDDSLTSSWSTGASHIATVDDSSHTLTLDVNGKKEGTYPVSLGASNTPTSRGIKVIMEKGNSICMSGPGYHICGVRYTQRLTYGGEYLHSAPWNCEGSPGCTGPENNIGRADSSNGCTNLTPTDAAKLYHILRIGDVVEYPNANGPAMQLGSGYGDWNVPWGQWLTGGLVQTDASAA